MASSPFPSFPISGITILTTPLITSALEYTKQHTSPTTVNHCLRSTAFALILFRKIPALNKINPETVTLSTLMHDLGWATTKELVSKDKRFDVDGANLAKAFISSQSASSSSEKFSEERLNLIWTAIALHTTGSISLEYPDPHVPIVHYGILADFAGPNFPGGLISVEEYKEVVTAFPRLGFAEGVKEIMCNLCREKPETTFDNFVSGFGVKFLGGSEGEEFKNALARANPVDMLMGGLEACKQWE
jgi:hypothetical protein